MQTFALRLLHLAAVLFGVSLIVFFLLEFLPGDPAEAIVAGSGDRSEEALAAVRAELGLDRPVAERYLGWIGGVMQGDMGASYRTGQSVLDAIAKSLPVTFQLVIMVQIVSLLVAIPVALYVAARRDTLLDRVVAFLTFSAQSIPNYVIALVGILVLSVQMGLLPAIGYTPLSQGLWPSIRSLIIPTVAMSAVLMPVYIRVLRSSIIQTLQQEYMLVGRAMGLSRPTLLYRYALKPSLPTLVTVVGVNFGVLIGGTVVVEAISGLPGMGTLLLNAVNTRDYILVQGLVLVFAVTYVAANFIVDIMQLVIDPRTRA